MSARYLGIDLGGTNTKIGIGTSDGEILKSISIPTEPAGGAEAWVRRVADAVGVWNEPYISVGVGSPGPLETQTGTILESWNLRSFEGTGMRHLLERALGTRVFFENDANCGALAEHMFGAYKNTPHLVVLTLGTGIGSGVVVDHKLVRGAGGFATEIGHMIIDRTLSDSKIQEFGCLEGYVGANKSIARFAQIANEDVSHLTMREIFHRADLSDPVALNFVNQWLRDLAIGLANVALIFNPNVIVLAGGVTASWGMMRDKIIHFLKDFVPAPILRSCQVDISHLGEFFGVYGAIALAIRESTGETWQDQVRQHQI